MWDFRNFPKDKIADTAKALEGVKLSGDFKNYTDIPASEKLQIAEKVYRLLGKDDKFWADFYRVLGYHFAREKKPEQAAQARQKALEITLRMLADNTNSGQKKELLVTAAALHHFLAKDGAAVGELKTASLLKFEDPKLDKGQAAGYDAYLSSLIKEYLAAIEKGNVPEDTEQPGD